MQRRSFLKSGALAGSGFNRDMEETNTSGLFRPLGTRFL